MKMISLEFPPIKISSKKSALAQNSNTNINKIKKIKTLIIGKDNLFHHVTNFLTRQLDTSKNRNMDEVIGFIFTIKFFVNFYFILFLSEMIEYQTNL